MSPFKNIKTLSWIQLPTQPLITFSHPKVTWDSSDTSDPLAFWQNIFVYKTHSHTPVKPQT